MQVVPEGTALQRHREGEECHPGSARFPGVARVDPGTQR